MRLFLLLLCCHIIGAAEITLASGQILDGEIVAENDGMVTIEFRSGNGSGRIKLPADQISSVADTGNEAIGDSSLSGSLGRRDAYAPLRLSGTIGSEIRAQPLQAAFQEARRRRVGAVVIVIDSSQPGDAKELVKIADVLKTYREQVDIHVVAKNALGAGLIFPLFAHETRITPGAQLGGLPFADDDPDAELSRREAAITVSKIAERYGKSGALFRAMIDPDERFAIWKDAQSASGLAMGIEPITADAEVIVRVDAGELLVLTAEHFRAAGLPTISNETEYRSAFAIDNWEDAGSQVQDAYAKAMDILAKREAREERGTQRKIDKVLDKRESAEQVLEFSLQQAQIWNPDAASYTTIQGSGSRRGWWRRSHVSYEGAPTYGKDKGRLTPESRQKWKMRSDITIKHLENAVKAVESLMRVEKDAEKLGLERAYSDEELKQMRIELRTQHAWVVNWRQQNER